MHQKRLTLRWGSLQLTDALAGFKGHIDRRQGKRPWRGKYRRNWDIWERMVGEGMEGKRESREEGEEERKGRGIYPHSNS